ncbi:DUF4097 family beta strand repeat-containing protein [Kribbella sp. NPDC050470]|uniref:DUF4097 family beta strand repeat-containing protein n=1 Tax=unclassified Kribbella TaxID=2644121 RepID=UPI00378C7925
MTAFDTPAPISATVDIVFGDIRFIAGDRTDTVVQVRPVDPSWELDVKAAEQVVVEFADGKLSVRHPKLRTVLSKKFGRVEVVVELPAGSDVHADTAQGDYVVEGVVGSCRLKTPAGDIRVEQAGSVELKTSGGRVLVDHVRGQAEVRGNREIRIRRVDGGAVLKNIGGDSWVGEVAGELRVSAANGDITVDVARAGVDARTAIGNVRVGEAGGDVDLYTATGEVEVAVPEGTAVHLDARTTAGRVFDHLKPTPQSARPLNLRARSHSGNITIRTT